MNIPKAIRAVPHTTIRLQMAPSNFEVRHPRCVNQITNMAGVQSKRNYMYIARGGTHSYQQLHVSASILAIIRLYFFLLSSNYTMYSVSVADDEISFTNFCSME